MVMFGKDKFRVDLVGLWLGGHEPGNPAGRGFRQTRVAT